jgi:hypothetical protein
VDANSDAADGCARRAGGSDGSRYGSVSSLCESSDVGDVMSLARAVVDRCLGSLMPAAVGGSDCTDSASDEAASSLGACMCAANASAWSLWVFVSLRRSVVVVVRLPRTTKAADLAAGAGLGSSRRCGSVKCPMVGDSVAAEIEGLGIATAW